MHAVVDSRLLRRSSGDTQRGSMRWGNQDVQRGWQGIWQLRRAGTSGDRDLRDAGGRGLRRAVERIGSGLRVCTGSDRALLRGAVTGTQNVGICKGGTKTCLSTGTGYGTCEGQVLPSTESCLTPEDDDCSGANLVCTDSSQDCSMKTGKEKKPARRRNWAIRTWAASTTQRSRRTWCRHRLPLR